MRNSRKTRADGVKKRFILILKTTTNHQVIIFPMMVHLTLDLTAPTLVVTKAPGIKAIEGTSDDPITVACEDGIATPNQ